MGGTMSRLLHCPAASLCLGDAARHHLTHWPSCHSGEGMGPTACGDLAGGRMWWVASACPPLSVAASWLACTHNSLWEVALGRGLTTVFPEEPMFVLQECPTGQPRLLESLFASLTQSIQWRHIVPLAARILWRSCWSRCPCLAVPGKAGQSHCRLLSTSRGGSCWSSF